MFNGDMKKSVLGFILENKEIFSCIVLFVFVYVMHDLCWVKIPFKCLFSNKPTPKNILISIKRMVWRVCSYISFYCFEVSTFPVIIIFASVPGDSFSLITGMSPLETICKRSFACKGTVIALARAKLSGAFQVPLDMKNLIAHFTCFLNHKVLQIKKALFGGLKKTVTFPHLLRAFDLDIKNPFSLSSYSVSQIG